MPKDFKTELGLEAQRIILSLRGVEDLDDKKFDPIFGEQKQRADYLFMDRAYILEHKEILTDREDATNTWINNQMATDEWLANSVFGKVPVEDIIQKHPNSKDFRNRLLQFIYRNFEKDVLKKAANQLSETERSLGTMAVKVLFLTVTTDKAITYEGVKESILHFFKRNSGYSLKVNLFILLYGNRENFSKYKIELFDNPFNNSNESNHSEAEFLSYQIAARAQIPIIGSS